MGFTFHVPKSKCFFDLRISFELSEHVQSALAPKRTQSQSYLNKTYLAANVGSIIKRDNFKMFSRKLKPPLFILHRGQSQLDHIKKKTKSNIITR